MGIDSLSGKTLNNYGGLLLDNDAEYRPYVNDVIVLESGIVEKRKLVPRS